MAAAPACRIGGHLCPSLAVWPAIAAARAVFEICDRVNLVQQGEITFDKPACETSAEELTDLVVKEYRQALEERQRRA